MTTYYVKDWYSYLKLSREWEDPQPPPSPPLSLPLQSDSRRRVLPQIRELRLNAGSHINESLTASTRSPSQCIKNETIEQTALGSLVDAFCLLFTTASSLVTLCCFMLSFLIMFLLTGSQQIGLVFLLTSLIVLTCVLFYYPTYRLLLSGGTHMRLLKWIYVTLCAAIFFFVIRNHTQFCSCIVLATTVGLKLFRELPLFFPRTFTFNELVIVCTSASNGAFVMLTHLYRVNPTPALEEVVVVEHALVWLLMTVIVTARFRLAHSNLLGFVSSGTLLLAVYFVPVIYLTLRQNAFVWLAAYVSVERRAYLIMCWCGLFNSMSMLVGLRAVYFGEDVAAMSSETASATTATATTSAASSRSPMARFSLLRGIQSPEQLTKIRKIFHLLICVVFVLGFAVDVRLLFLCSYGVFIMFTLVETARYFRIGQLGQLVEKAMSLFMDEKDRDGELVLSHIYLLVGFAYPLWISDITSFNIAQLSGLITVGIGDSFASLVGSKFGKNKFPGSNKSLEGSLALMCSQLVVYLLLGYGQLFDATTPSNWLFIAVSLIASAYVEAFTVDNDNLVLPIVVYPFLYLLR